MLSTTDKQLGTAFVT